MRSLPQRINLSLGKGGGGERIPGCYLVDTSAILVGITYKKSVLLFFAVPGVEVRQVRAHPGLSLLRAADGKTDKKREREREIKTAVEPPI